MSILSRTPPRRDSWALTQWSILSKLDRREEPHWQASWTYLMETYRAPMERYVRRVLSRTRGRPASHEEAAEIVQDFLATCVEKEWLSRADPTRGRFRAYIQTLLKRYVYRVIKHANAQRRSPGPDRQVYSLLEDRDESGEAAVEDPSDLDAFNEGWVQVAVDRALKTLATEHERYQAVVADLIATDGEGSADLAQRMGLSRAQFPVLKHRARKRFCKLFEEELAKTVGDQDAFDEEWRALQPYLR